MSQQYFYQQQQGITFNPSAGPTNQFNFNLNVNSQQEQSEESKPRSSRRNDTNFWIEKLYKGTLVLRPGERIRTGGRKNKNEILGLTLARLIKEKYLNGNTYTREIELSRGVKINPNNSEFVLVLRTDGRIVAMSDEVEHHLGKSMRSLYTQCINIFECLNETDGNKLRSILNSSTNMTDQSSPLVCTFRMPKGKRPSRKHEDVKTITIAGHFISCSESSNEKLFIARCQALLSRTTNGSSSSSQTTMINANNDNTNSMIKFLLNEDMSIHMVSSNVQDTLGYSSNEMIGNWFGRYLTTNDLEKFEKIRQKYFQHQQNEKQLPNSVCDIFDIYTNNGEGRLTFLCQIRPKREPRAKPIKFSIVAQLIDPTLRNECIKYVQTESEASPKPIKAEQVNLVSSTVSKTSEDTILANSPSLANGLLMFDNIIGNDYVQHQQQYSPFHRSLSNFVAPVNVNDQLWHELFDFDYNEYPTTGTQSWSTKSFDDTFNECQSGQTLDNIFDEFFNDILNG